MYLLEGGTGTGKTTIGLQFLLEGARLGERGLFISLSASRQALEEVAHSHGWSLAPLCLFELMPALARLQPEEQQSVFHPAELELEDQSQAFDPRKLPTPLRVALARVLEGAGRGESFRGRFFTQQGTSRVSLPVFLLGLQHKAMVRARSARWASAGE
jgi:hypothetical protein